MKLIYTSKVVSFTGSNNTTNFNVEGRLALTNNNGDEFAVIAKTDLSDHDIEHLLYGLGYSLTEEKRIYKTSSSEGLVSQRQPLFDISEWKALFCNGNEDFYLSKGCYFGQKFTVICSLDKRKVTVDVTYN